MNVATKVRSLLEKIHKPRRYEGAPLSPEQQRANAQASAELSSMQNRN